MESEENHQINIEKGTDNKYHCPQCTNVYTRGNKLKLHIQKAHGLQTKDRNRQVCEHPGCNETFYKRRDLIQHQKNVHNMEFDERTFQFESMEDFYKWKEQEELSNHVSPSRLAKGRVQPTSSVSLMVTCTRIRRKERLIEKLIVDELLGYQKQD